MACPKSGTWLSATATRFAAIMRWTASNWISSVMLSFSNALAGASLALRHKYGVKVYPSLDDPRVRDKTANQLRSTPATYRGRALEAWSSGADGVYMFNFFDPRSPLWRELGDPTPLVKLDRNYFAS